MGQMKIGITGASGFLGGALTAALRHDGHTVVSIGRGAADIQWDPSRGAIDTEACADIEVFIHLAGANVGGRWTPEHKRAIRDSRVQGTALIANTVAAVSPRPRVLICASAIGIYGNAGNAVCDETAPTGRDFLAEVGVAWEGAAAPARRAGVRTVHLRFGIVLGSGGGALPRMLPAFRMGAGGRLGSGQQWMSWISLDDAVAAVRFAIAHESLDGAVNVVAPAPVTNAEFTATLARVVRRPALFPVPAVALKLMFGEMAEGTLLVSQRVVPRRLQGAGFQFQHPTLEAALRAAVNA